MALDLDGAHDLVHCFGDGQREDQYLVGDWDNDGADELAVRRGNCINMAFDLDGAHDAQQCYGNGTVPAPRLTDENFERQSLVESSPL